MKLLISQCFLILILSSTSPAVSGFAGPQEIKSALVDELRLIVQQQEEDQPGISVLVKKDDEVLFQLSKGLANKNKDISIASSTGFRIGSISKPFTALAVLKLVEQERLSLNENVTEYFSELSNVWEDITIEHLLSHRVYISDDFFADSNLMLANSSTNKDVIKFLASKNIKVKPREADEAIYCNSCFVLLAEIIAKVSEVSFSDYLSENIFAPANMKHTYILEKGGSIKTGDALNFAKTESFFGINQYTTGAMAQVSSIDDLNHFMVALKSGHIISKNSLSLMTKAYSHGEDGGAFGLGWVIGWGEQPFYAHGGSQDGYQTELFFHPKHDLEVAILTNGGDKTYRLQAQIMRAILDHYH